MSQRSSILGNDPFLRGAATREPAAKKTLPSTGTGKAKPAAKEAKRKGSRSKRPVAQKPAVEKAAPMPKVESAAGAATRQDRTEPKASREPSKAASTAVGRVFAETAFSKEPDIRYDSGIDEFGLDPEVERRWRPRFEAIHDKWFRVEVRGMHNIPKEGPALLVGNHGGALPWDAVMLKTAVEKSLGPTRRVRPLVEDFIFHLPFLGTFLNRYGAVRACQENAERLLSRGSLLAVFPEGLQGLGKRWSSRYELGRFGRGGFVKLALRTGAPIVPVAIVGSDDVHPILFNPSFLTTHLGLPYLPFTPTFPLLGPLGLLPLPVKWHIEIGEPFSLSGHGPGTATDRALVTRLSDQVRSEIQERVDRLRGLRRNMLR